MRVVAIAGVLTAALLSNVHAQPAGAQAEVLFKKGRELMQKGQYADACIAFDQSQKLEPAPTTLLNLAGCREKTNELATAWGLFLEAERATRSAMDATNKQLHDVAKSKAAKLEPRISKLTINVAPGSDGVEVKRGTERVEPAMWGTALPIDGGTYTITASAPGKKTWSTEITIAIEKDAKTVDIPVLESPTIATTPPPAPTPTPPLPTTTVTAEASASGSKLPYIVGGGGLALVGGAVGIGLWGRSQYNDAKAEMSNQMRRDDLEKSANNKLLVAQIAGIAGVATIGVAVWLLIRGDGDESPTTARVLSVTPDGIAIGGSF